MQWIGNVDVNFYLGLTLGVGIFMAGFLFGRITTGDSIVAKVRKVFSREQYHDPGEVYDDAFFERARYSPMEGVCSMTMRMVQAMRSSRTWQDILATRSIYV